MSLAAAGSRRRVVSGGQRTHKSIVLDGSFSRGLRVGDTTCVEKARALAQEQRALPGLYAGNPTRATTRPTAELLLTAFKDITLTVVRTPHLTLRHLTALSPTPHDILALLGFTPDIYAFVEHYLPQPP